VRRVAYARRLRVRYRSDRIVGITCAIRPQPPFVKSSFYKNPSRAIEKGGGFFIPGLRGPRLRYAVGAILLALLVANMPDGILISQYFASDILASTKVSTALGALAGCGVLFTALQDSRGDERPRKTVEAEPMRNDKTEGKVGPSSDAVSTSTRNVIELGSTAKAELSWVANVVNDMVNREELGCDVWFFGRDAASGSLQFVYSEKGRGKGGTTGCDAGAVVERVSQEGRSLYVEDSYLLPDEIGFPFLPGDERWSVLAVPIAGGNGVFVVTVVKAGDRSTTLSIADRAWLEVFGERAGQSFFSYSRSA
jgi:hypothetical protein